MFEQQKLAVTALTHLDLGIFVCLGAKGELVFATPPAEEALRALGGTRRSIPDCLHDMLRDANERFGTARCFVASDGRQYYVRSRRLDEPRGAVLATIAVRRPRAADRSELLRKLYGLTPRECTLVNFVCEGLRNDEIAERMKLTAGTVKQYLHAVFTSLDVRSRGQLVATLERMLNGAGTAEH